MAFPTGLIVAPAQPSVDVESLLWEVRDLLRGLTEINASQAAQLTQLSLVSPVDDAISAEYAERSRAALEAVDVVLGQLQFQSQDDEVADDSSEFDDTPVRRWLHSIQPPSGHETYETPPSSASSYSPTVADSSDFWAADTSFKWDEEPEDEDLFFDSASSIEAFGPDLVLDCPVSVLGDDAVDPSDSISMRDTDSEYDSESESEFSFEEIDDAHYTSSGSDSVTLFYSEPHHSLAGQPHVVFAKGAKFASPTSAELFAAHPALLAGF